MQKLINVLALASFAVSAAVVGGGTWLYLNKDVLVERAREKVASAATEAVAGALPGLIDAAMPALPDATGGVAPMGESGTKYTGGALRLP